MKKYAIRISFVIITISSTGGFAQEMRKWTIEECIEYALENNITIKRKELAKESKQLDVNDAAWAYAPRIGFNSSMTLSSGRVLDQTTYDFIKNSTIATTTSSLSGSMTLFDGFKKKYALKRAKLDLLSESVALESTNDDIKRSVAAAFFSFLCAEADLESARQTCDLIRSQINRIQSLVDVGRIPESELILMRANLYAAESDYQSARGNLESSRLDLCQLMGFPANESLSLSWEEHIPLPPINTSYSDEVLSLPEYRQAQITTDIARQDLRLAQSAFYPSLSLSSGYGSSSSSARMKAIQNDDGTFKYEAYPFVEQYLDNRSFYISLGISIPIFNSMLTRNNVHRRKIALKDAEYMLEAIEQRLCKSVYQARIDCETAYLKMLSSQEELKYAEEAERRIRDQYTLGAADFNTWNTSVVELAKAKYAVSGIKFTYFYRLKILEFYHVLSPPE